MRIAPALAALLLSALPAAAEPVAGTEDPAFTEPFGRLLQANDTAALDALHAAALAGNTAALLALPAALDWLRPALKERRRYLDINGTRLADAVAAASPVAADWAGGNPNFAETDDLIARALRLYDEGEMEKATGFLLTWINQTGPWAPLPEALLDRPLPVLADYFLLVIRLGDPTSPDPAPARALAIQRLGDGSPGAAMALAHVAGMHRADGPLDPELAAEVPRILTEAGLSPEEGEARLQAALPALLLVQRWELPDAATATAAAAFLAQSSDLMPIRQACAAACPETAPACTAAWMLAFNLPQGRGGIAQPFTALIQAEDFWASPRGIDLLFARALAMQPPEFATGPLLQAATALDACFAATLTRPLP